MLNVIIKICFAVVGAITGFTLTQTAFSIQELSVPANIRTAAFVAAAAFVGLIFYSIASKIIEYVTGALDRIELAIQKITLYELTVIAGGLIAGLIVANLITLPISKLLIVGAPLSIIANILFGSIGIGIAFNKRNEDWIGKLNRSGGEPAANCQAKLLDTSVIIDGRIVDICRAGFIDGELIIPGFILEELRHVADSQDTLKRNRGRRGLDVLNMLQKDLQYPVRVENIAAEKGVEVDEMLLKAAKQLGAKILTNDYNLNKVASIQGVTVLNINELANAMKPIALPGEEMVVQIVKDGKENGQGVAYLDDGTMIVVDGGKRHMGETVCVTVTSVLQTAAGRMIFARPKCLVEKVI